MELRKLLLVDDDSAFNFLNRIILNASGVDCEIEECLDGKSALEQASDPNSCPDVILLDINMPIMDGFEFLDEFDKRHQCSAHTKVFILTSSSQDEDRHRAMSYSCVKGYFDKPLCAEHVEEILTVLKAC